MLFINKVSDLIRDIEYYASIFPESYIDYDSIKKRLDGKEDEPVGKVFGIEVSSEWKDKCYGFEVDSVRNGNTFIQYLGVWKS